MEIIVGMIRQIGKPVKLETVISWNPMISKTDIETCKELEIINGMVLIKKASMDIENLTYDQLIDLIDKYNKKVKKDFENYDEKKLKIAAIKKWLTNRYEEVKALKSSELYESFEVKRKGNTQYVAICDRYTEEVGRSLLEVFNDEDLTICYISRVYNYQLGFFSFMDANDIIVGNIDKYTLKSKQLEILKIEKEKDK